MRLEDIVARAQAARHPGDGRCGLGTYRAAEPVAGARRRHGDLQRRKIPARAADQRPVARPQGPDPGGVAQCLAAPGVRARHEGVEGGRDRRAGRARGLVRASRPGGGAGALERRSCATIAGRLACRASAPRSFAPEGRGARAAAARALGRGEYGAGRRGGCACACSMASRGSCSTTWRRRRTRSRSIRSACSPARPIRSAAPSPPRCRPPAAATSGRSGAEDRRLRRMGCPGVLPARRARRTG